MIEEKRKIERNSHFHNSDFTTIFYVPTYQKHINAMIMNLSEEGIGLAVKQDNISQTLEKGDHLVLESMVEPIEIQGLKELNILTNRKMEIKWIIKFKRIAVGCKFLDIC